MKKNDDDDDDDDDDNNYDNLYGAVTRPYCYKGASKIARTNCMHCSFIYHLMQGPKLLFYCLVMDVRTISSVLRVITWQHPCGLHELYNLSNYRLFSMLCQLDHLVTH